MSKITPCLWYDGKAEDAANFYVTLFPDSRVDNVVRSPTDTPSGPEGYVMVVEFTLAGQPYIGLNGGPQFPFTEAISFQVRTEDQAETDRLWDHFSKGGKTSACGWVKDKWGHSWQITPKRFVELMTTSSPEARKRIFGAMMEMTKMDIAKFEAAAKG